jgi:hypothetical protein
MNKDQLIQDMKTMIDADRIALVQEIDRGDRAKAHATLDAIIITQQKLEDLLNS